MGPESHAVDPINSPCRDFPSPILWHVDLASASNCCRVMGQLNIFSSSATGQSVNQLTVPTI
jgi:hypothetical protein